MSDRYLDTLKRLLDLTSAEFGDEFFRALVRSLSEALDVDHVFIAHALDTPVTRVPVQASWNRGAFKDSWDYELSGNPCLIPYEGQATMVPCNVNRDFEKKKAFPYQGFIGVLLKDTSGGVYGHLAVYADRELSETGFELEIAQLFAGRAEAEARRKILEEELRGTVEELRVLNDRLLEESRVDALTGLANRRAWQDAAEREFSRSRCNNTPLAILYGDLDHFKQINDIHGHGAGDHVLRMAGRAIQAAVRTDVDIAARIGGEEFAVLLPETEPGTAAEVAERIRESVAAMNIRLDSGKTISPTISIGVAGLDANDSGWKMPMARADQALYQAKQAGRNMISGMAA